MTKTQEDIKEDETVKVTQIDLLNDAKGESRNKVIVRTSIIGILVNVALAAFKAVIGMLSNSIAITLDAVNNISDAGSSIITIVGTKLAGKEPDRKHPFGYGRIEYLSAMIIAVIVLYAGFTSLEESVKKIIHPEASDYSAVALVIIAVAVVAKIMLGSFFKSTGKKVNSDSLVNSGQDATMDSVISASTLLAAVVYLIFHVSLEAWLGAIISVVIMKSGIDMLRETIGKLLGTGADPELVKKVKATVNSFDEVHGAYDLILHDYGPDRYNGSIHIEVPDTLTADEIDELIRKIALKVYEKHGVILTGIGLYSMNTKNNHAAQVRDSIRKMVMKNEYVNQMHGFYLCEAEKTIRFDLVISFRAKDRQAVFREVVEQVQAAYPDYQVAANMDTDFSEL